MILESIRSASHIIVARVFYIEGLIDSNKLTHISEGKHQWTHE